MCEIDLEIQLLQDLEQRFHDGIFTPVGAVGYAAELMAQNALEEVVLNVNAPQVDSKSNKQ